MKKICLAFGFLVLMIHCESQPIETQLKKGWQQLKKDSIFRHAIAAVEIRNLKTGKLVFSDNEEIGLAPASCQKIFTSIAAFEILGPSYHYVTRVGYDGRIDSGTLHGNFFIVGSGDPSLGSWRWAETRDNIVINKIIQSILHQGILRIDGEIYIDDSKFSFQPVPGGWIWEDIGNYYGAGCWGLNWHENQYDLILNSGMAINEPVKIAGWEPRIPLRIFLNEIRSGEKESGDNGYIYLPPYSQIGFAEGTIPAGSSQFTISGSMPYAPQQFARELQDGLDSYHIRPKKGISTWVDRLLINKIIPREFTEILSINSPSFDSLNFWFLKKSINLYGEVLIKTFAASKFGIGNTEQGVEILKEFWKEKGIDESSLQIVDGSGLSPQNRVTTASLVAALRFAQTRPWFNSFYLALPEINGMKMKSGSIGGARSYAGYQKSSDNKEYVFAITINNCGGDASIVVKKIWHFLDLLK